MAYQPCTTEEIESALETFHPNYKTVLIELSLIDEVKQLVNEREQFSVSYSRELIISEAVIKVVSNSSRLESSIWFG